MHWIPITESLLDLKLPQSCTGLFSAVVQTNKIIFYLNPGNIIASWNLLSRSAQFWSLLCITLKVQHSTNRKSQTIKHWKVLYAIQNMSSSISKYLQNCCWSITFCGKNGLGLMLSLISDCYPFAKQNQNAALTHATFIPMNLHNEILLKKK